MFRQIALFSVLVPTAFAQSLPELREVENFKDLSSYLEEATLGAVRPTGHSTLSFRINHKESVATPILAERNPDLVHSLFETDIYKVMDAYGGEDFVTAKKNYYAAQKFDAKKQRYVKPYVFPSDWQSLFHNPIRIPTLPLEDYGAQFAPLDEKAIASSPLLDPDFQHHLDEVTNTELTAGNKMRQLNNGMVSFQEKLRMVKQTKKYFHAVVMVQYCDEKGDEMVDAMIERAQAGKDVRLIVENVWTKLILKKCLKKLQDGGVKVTLGKGFFNPKTMFTVHHTKFWIRDGEEAIIGGQNMHDSENLSNGFNGHTRDKDVHVVGPAVTDMQREYIKIWNEQQKRPDSSMTSYLPGVIEKEKAERLKGLRGKQLYDNWLERNVAEIPGVCRVLVQGTKITSQPSIIAKAYIEIMNNMKYSFFATSMNLRYGKLSFSPYSNAKIIDSLVGAAKRGVKVDLVSNGYDAGWGEAGFQVERLAKYLRSKGQNSLAKLAEGIARIGNKSSAKSNRKHISKILIGPNVDSWFYFNHTHSKQMMFDQIMTSTGSFNLDTFSYRNHESTMICIDQDMAQQAMAGFVTDIINSTPVPKL